MTARSTRWNRQDARLLLSLLAVMWVVEVSQWIAGRGLLEYGIIPRNFHGLVGIVFAPFLHGSISHLVVNSLPFLILGGLVSLSERNKLLDVTLTVAGLGGFLVWIFGRGGSVHVGASGVISGYFGFLLSRAYHKRDLRSIVIAAVTLFLYGGMAFGILPTRAAVSWESHLFGLIAGVLAARR